MSEEEKKKPFFDPNGLYNLKNGVGFLSVLIGGVIASLFLVFLFVGLALDLFEESGNGFNNWLGYWSSWKIDVGLAILLGSTIISGSILLSGIRKV